MHVTLFDITHCGKIMLPFGFYICFKRFSTLYVGRVIVPVCVFVSYWQNDPPIIQEHIKAHYLKGNT